MASKTLNIAQLHLSLSLLYYVISAAAGECNTSGIPFTTPPLTSSSGGGGRILERCPRDALKLGVCVNLLGGLIGVEVGKPPATPCCVVVAGLLDIEAAVCFCTAIKANLLGINLNVPVILNLLLNVCGRNVPTGFIC